jgi:hypothetical protein
VESKYEKRPNTGSLFATKVKTTQESPDFKGDILIDVKSLDVQQNGTALIKLSGWKNVAKETGQKYVSLKVDQWKPDPTKTIQRKRIDDDLDF